MVKKQKSLRHSKLPYILCVVVVLVAIGGIYAYHTTNKPKKPITTVDQYTKGQVSQPTSSSKSSTSSSSQSTTPPSSSKTGGTSATLVAPTGNFVSDHHPNLSGSPAPSSMTSVCNTTPGASCQISFTNDGITKSLPTQVTDGGGATYWYWTLQQIGLAAGNWTVSATSSLNGNSLSATDPMTLVVSQ